MGQLLIVSTTDRLAAYGALADTYGVGFECNDFFAPQLLDEEARVRSAIQAYERYGLPSVSTLHGAFYDVVVFSQDAKIREISRMRMEQSMEIAARLGVTGVVFHNNAMPMLSAPEYDRNVISLTVAYLEELLTRYPHIQIYMENMFDANPDLLAEISHRLFHRYDNYGVCLDYAHASISPTPAREWVQTLHPYVKHLHINDNDGVRDLHLPVGAGVIDWDVFADEYQQYFASCSLLIETNEPAAQEQSIRFLREHYPNVFGRVD
jgi:sugar phosphate isomerase/epimerase